MSIFQFWADPVGWFVNSFTWWFTSPAWYVALNLLFWPALFLKAWLHDRWDDRQRRRKHERALAARLPA
jgi:hypothetical protein